MTDVSVPLDRDSRAPLWWLLHLTTLKDVKFYVKPSEFSTGKGKGEGKGGRGGGRGGAPYGRGAGRGGQVTSIFSGNDAVQQIFGDEGENAQDFNAWMDGIMNGDTDAVQHVAAPILGSFANFFGNSSMIDVCRKVHGCVI